MIYLIGATSNTVDIQIVDDSGLPVTGLVAATFPTLTYSLAGPNADVAFPSLSDLALITTAFASGGVKERGNGVYRLDVPNGAFASGGVATIRGEASGKHVLAEKLHLVAFNPQSATNLGLSGVPTANPGAANGSLIAGSNAATTITSSTGSALTLSSTGSNGHGLLCQGNGSGNGQKNIAGASGQGMENVGGSTSGNGQYNHAPFGGNGLGQTNVGVSQVGFSASSDVTHAASFASGTNADALHLVSNGTGHDINLAGDTYIQGNLYGKVGGGGSATIAGPGAWVLSEAGADLAKVSDLLTTAQVATGVWTDVVDNTTSGSYGKMLLTTLPASVAGIPAIVSAGSVNSVATAITLPANPPTGFLIAGSFAANSIADSAFLVPADGSGQAAGMMSKLLWLYNENFLPQTYDKVANTLKSFHSDGVTVRITRPTTTSSTTDTVGLGV